MTDVCELLEWDSAFFGVPIARLHARRLTEELVQQVDEWTAAQGVQCLYFLADAGDAPTVRLAEQHGFRLVDVRVVYQARLNELRRVVPESQMTVVRPAVPEDVPACQAIARTSYRQTRFYNDPGFSPERCDDLYATWIERSVHGWADGVLVMGPVGAPYAYVTCHRDGRMGIAALREDRRGRGEGLVIYQAAFDWFADERIEPIILVTQGHNIVSQRLFHKFGARIMEVALWYHRWPAGSTRS